jgi:hypothetical protein
MQRSQAEGRELLQKRLSMVNDHMLYSQEEDAFEGKKNIQKENMV